MNVQLMNVNHVLLIKYVTNASKIYIYMKINALNSVLILQLKKVVNALK